MQILFVSSLPSSYTDQNSSYLHRLISLKNGLEEYDVVSEMLYLGDLPLSKPSISHPLNVSTILRDIKHYDVIHAGGPGSAYTIGLLKRFIDKDTKIVYDIHGDAIAEVMLTSSKSGWFEKSLKVSQIRIMEKVALAKSDYFITCSQSLRQRYVGRGISKEKIEVIYNTVDPELFKPNYSNYPSNFIVTFAGRFQKWQGIDLLIDAIESINDSEILFKIIGFRDDNFHLRDCIDKKLGKQVLLIDDLPRTELIDHMQRSNILVIPRKQHPALEVAFPTKFGEYVATGIPVIVTDVGDIAQLTREYQCGFVCEATSQSLAETITSAKKYNRMQLIAMGQRGREVALDKLTQKKVCETYYTFLIKILAGNL